MKPISQRCSLLQPSLTIAIDTLAKQLKAQGMDILSLGAGEPDFATPTLACAAGIQSIGEGKTRYTAPEGILELREAVCNKILREQKTHYTPEQIVISSGAKHAIHNALALLVNPGDEILIPTPHWVTYPELVRYFGGIPVLVPCALENGFSLNPADIKSRITARTKAIILNSPCNPTGHMLGRPTLEAIANIMEIHDLYCIADEIYEHIAFQEPHISLAQISSSTQNRTLLISGVSKSYAMTGWRIGYTATSSTLANALGRLQAQTTHHPSNVAQYAAMVALEKCESAMKTMCAKFLERKNLVLEELRSIPKMLVHEPLGAFYVFPSIEPWLGTITPQGKTMQNSEELAKWLLAHHGLALVPGSAFGENRCMRLSFATDENTLRKALLRLRTGLGELRKIS